MGPPGRNRNRSSGGSRGVVPPDQQGGLPDEELGAPPRHEHAGRHGDPQAAELGPAENLLQRQAGHTPVHHRVEFVRCPCGGHEQTGFVLGENATRGPEPANDDSVGDRHIEAEPGRSPP